MPGEKNVVIAKHKEPTYVPIYEALYEEVTGGAFAAGAQLPPETKLAEKYGVSRNTLRQALAILCEDGLVYNVQGKGNFVSRSFDQIPQGVERLDNLMLSAAKVTCDEIKILYSYGPPAKIVQDKLQIKASDITLSSNNTYFAAGSPIGYAYMEIPARVIAELDMDMNDESRVQELLNTRLFEVATTASSRVTLTVAEESIADFLQTGQNVPLIFIEEILFNHTGHPLGLCKYYLLPKNYSINLTRKK